MDYLKKPVTGQDVAMSEKSVEKLNEAIRERFPDLPDIQIIAWASDLHIHGNDVTYPEGFGKQYINVDCTRQLTLCLHEINALEKKPDFIVLGGDVTDMGLKEEWLELARILRLGITDIPTLPVLGNHDHMFFPAEAELMALWEKVRQPGWPDFPNPNELFYSKIINGYKHIILDKHSSNRLMSGMQKDFLYNEIKNTEHKIVIYQHSHVLPAGNWTDAGVQPEKDVMEMILNSPDVLGVFSGHSHKTSLWSYRGKLFASFPTTVFGLSDRTGWGGIILSNQEIKGVFIKELYGQNFNDDGHRMQEGAYRFMEPRFIDDSSPEAARFL